MTKHEAIAQAIEFHPLSMADAARHCGLAFGTFKYHAIKLGLYRPNQSGKGRTLPNRGNKYRIDINDVLSGKVEAHGGSAWIRKKLLQAGIKHNVCECCGLDGEWCNEPIQMQLDHVDGNNKNNSLDNLQMLCPNCHSQTETFAGRNKKKNVAHTSTVSWVAALQESNDIRGALKKLGLKPSGANYRKAERLLEVIQCVSDGN
ncbi:MAG: HNH endonuclease [Neptunomonas phycophila]|uniref:HNH endonuclease signature motif containing protein n=1 Tax=Neptunomonas phycophila TaxID=1572645 RepID=UPI003B8DE8D0